MVLPDIDIDIPLDDLAESLEEGLISTGQAIQAGLEGVADEISDTVSDAGLAALDDIENSGIALMKAAGKTRDYFVQEIGDRRVQFVKQLTILIIVLMTTVFIYNSLMMKDR